MGRFERVVSFGVGYVAGSRLGARPAFALRDAATSARRAGHTALVRAETTTAAVRDRVASVTGDVRARTTAVAVVIRDGIDATTASARRRIAPRVARTTAVGGMASHRGAGTALATAVREASDVVVVVTDEPAVPRVDVDTLVRDAAASMASHRTDRVDVMGSGGMLGVVTEHDLVVLALAEGLDPMSTSVGDLLQRRSA